MNSSSQHLRVGYYDGHEPAREFPDLPLTSMIRSFLNLANYLFGKDNTHVTWGGHQSISESNLDSASWSWTDGDEFEEISDHANYYHYANSETRRLASSSGLSVDYSILSIAILTLGLLLVVELILHKLDELAKERKFFRHVLHTFYRECKYLIILTSLLALNFFSFPPSN
jgi:hypothetical protein